MVVKPKFRKVGERAVASYTAYDIISGTGYVQLYGGATVDDFPLTNITFYSYPENTQGTLGSTAVDIDFDVLINKTMTIKGKAIVNVPVQVALTRDTGSLKVTAYLRKWDGTTETEIVSNESSTLTGVVDTPVFRVFSIDLTVPQTHFKKGETLRLSVISTGVISGGTTPANYFYIYHDPKARTVVGVDTTQLSIQLPIKLKL